VAHLDRAGTDGVGRLQRRDDLAGREVLDHEIAIRCFANVLRDDFRRTEKEPARMPAVPA
jgi:hypothetical protein